MSKTVLGVVILALSLFCVVAQAGEPGIEEHPNVVRIGQPKMTTSPIYGAQSIPAAPPVAPSPVFSPEPVYAPQVFSAPPVCSIPQVCSAPCSSAPYQVTVEYEPIEPVGGSYTYCTCLPYGCPDGAPVVNGYGAYGACGSAPCGVVCAPSVNCGNIVGNLVSATLNLSGGIVSNAMCAVKTGTCGIISTAGGMVSCLLTGYPNQI